MAKDTRKLSTRQRVVGIARVARISFKASPLAVVMKIAGAIITAVLPLVTTYFAALTTTALAEAHAGDEAAGGRAIMYVLITAFLGVLMTAWSSLERYVNELVGYKINAAISDQMYEHFLNLEFWRYDDKHTADLFDKSQRFANFFGYAFDSLARIAAALISLITAVAALVLASWWLGLIVLIAVVPGVIIQFNLSRFRVRHWNENVETRRKLARIEWDMLQPQRIAELRLYGLVRNLLNLRMKLRDTDEKTRIEFERKVIWKQLGSDVLEAAAEVVALIYTTMQIIARAQPIGQFLYVQQIVSRAMGAVGQFTSGISSIDEDIANLFDYNEFMGLETGQTRTVKLREQPDTISLENVSFHYPSSETAVLEDISMMINKGQNVAIVGENGAGKSTLIKLILGLYEPTIGNVLVDGMNLKDVMHDSWHRYIGVLRQDYGVYSFATARENVMYGDVSTRRAEQRFEEAVHDAEAASFLEKLPKGYDTFVHQWMEHDDGTSGVELSGGQQQRLSLARNFYRDSPIIILDEPTSAIDALAESRIFKRLFAEKNKTIITVSHRLTTVQKADMIYVMEHGKIVEQGTHAQLVQKKGTYYTLFESQL